MAGTQAANAVRGLPLTEGSAELVRHRGLMTGGDRTSRQTSPTLQRRGIATATEVFERLIEELDGVERAATEAATWGLEGLRRIAGGPTDIPRSAQRSRARSTSTPISSAGHSELYADVVESVAAVNRRGQRPSPTGAGRRSPWPRRPGTEAIAAVWMHNASSGAGRRRRAAHDRSHGARRRTDRWPRRAFFPPRAGRRACSQRVVVAVGVAFPSRPPRHLRRARPGDRSPRRRGLASAWWSRHDAAASSTWRRRSPATRADAERNGGVLHRRAARGSSLRPGPRVSGPGAARGSGPSLLLAACQAYGGTAREGLGPAVALEMMHNAFLIHDDLEDASATRRGEPTLHELHGVGLAVNAGDALASWRSSHCATTGCWVPAWPSACSTSSWRWCE